MKFPTCNKYVWKWVSCVYYKTKYSTFPSPPQRSRWLNLPSTLHIWRWTLSKLLAVSYSSRNLAKQHAFGTRREIWCGRIDDSQWAIELTFVRGINCQATPVHFVIRLIHCTVMANRKAFLLHVKTGEPYRKHFHWNVHRKYHWGYFHVILMAWQVLHWCFKDSHYFDHLELKKTPWSCQYISYMSS